jgi:hypothetical protein
MVETLDVEALLAKNPRVDRDALRRGADAPKTPAPKAAPYSPYGGRRLVVNDKAKIEEATHRKIPSHYRVY